MRTRQQTRKLVKNVLLSGVCVVALAGCSWLGEWPPGNKKNAKIPQPQVKMVQTADATWLEPVAGNSREQLVPSNGVNVATEDRVKDLEQQLSDMRNDIGMMMPALTRLAEAQNNLVNTLSQMQPAAGMALAPVSIPQPASQQQHHYQQAPSSPHQQPVAMSAPQIPAAQQQQQFSQTPPQPAYGQQAPQSITPQAVPYPYHQQAVAPQPVPQQVIQAQPQPQMTPEQVAYNNAAATARTEIRQVRFGEHPDKTRIVLDVSNNVPFKYDIDNQERVLLIDFPGGSWGGPQQTAVENSPLVESYSVVPNGQGGAMVIVQLYSQAKVVWAQSIPSVGGKAPRTVIDITSL